MPGFKETIHAITKKNHLRDVNGSPSGGYGVGSRRRSGHQERQGNSAKGCNVVFPGNSDISEPLTDCCATFFADSSKVVVVVVVVGRRRSSSSSSSSSVVVVVPPSSPTPRKSCAVVMVNTPPEYQLARCRHIHETTSSELVISLPVLFRKTVSGHALLSTPIM